MRVLMVEPGKKPYAADINNDLEAMQRAVEGLIEPIDLDEGITMVCNEEGKLLGLEGNRRVGRDIICGTFFICGSNEEGEFISLTDEQLEMYSQRFEKEEYFTDEEIEDAFIIEVFPWEEEEDLEV